MSNSEPDAISTIGRESFGIGHRMTDPRRVVGFYSGPEILVNDFDNIFCPELLSRILQRKSPVVFRASTGYGPSHRAANEANLRSEMKSTQPLAIDPRRCALPRNAPWRTLLGPAGLTRA